MKKIRDWLNTPVKPRTRKTVILVGILNAWASYKRIQVMQQAQRQEQQAEARFVQVQNKEFAQALNQVFKNASTKK